MGVLLSPVLKRFPVCVAPFVHVRVSYLNVNVLAFLQELHGRNNTVLFVSWYLVLWVEQFLSACNGRFELSTNGPQGPYSQALPSASLELKKPSGEEAKLL